MIALILIALLAPQETDVEKLLKQLRDESIEVRESAALELVALGESVEERARKEFSAAQGDLKVRLEAILKRIERKRKLLTVLPPLQRITIDADDKPVKEVVEDFAAKTGITINQENLKGGPITVHVKEAAPLEALDAICDAAGFHFGLDRSRMTDLSNDPLGLRLYYRSYKSAPRAYVRHYSIRATSVSLQKSIDFRGMESGHVTVQMELLWPPTIRPEGIWKLQVNTAIDDKGATVYDRTKDLMIEARPSLARTGSSAGAKQPVFSMTLRNAGGIEKIATLRGEAELRYLLERKTLRFQDPASQVGKTVEHDGVTVLLKKFTHEGSLVRVQLEVAGSPNRRPSDRIPNEPASLIPVDSIKIQTEDGSSPQKGGYGGGGNSLAVDWMLVKSKVTAIEFEIDAEYHVDAFEFELKDIPMPK